MIYLHLHFITVLFPEVNRSNAFVLTYFAVSNMQSSREAELSPATRDSSKPPSCGGSITTASDMALGSHAVTARDKRHDYVNFKL